MGKPTVILKRGFAKSFFSLPFLIFMCVILVTYIATFESVLLVALVPFAIITNWWFTRQYSNNVLIFADVLIVSNPLVSKQFFFRLKDISIIEFNKPIKHRRKFNVVIHLSGKEHVYYVVSAKENEINKAIDILKPYDVLIKVYNEFGLPFR